MFGSHSKLWGHLLALLGEAWSGTERESESLNGDQKFWLDVIWTDPLWCRESPVSGLRGCCVGHLGSAWLSWSWYLACWRWRLYTMGGYCWYLQVCLAKECSEPRCRWLKTLQRKWDIWKPCPRTLVTSSKMLSVVAYRLVPLFSSVLFGYLLECYPIPASLDDTFVFNWKVTLALY